jgi:hypothetical protein
MVEYGEGEEVVVVMRVNYNSNLEIESWFPGRLEPAEAQFFHILPEFLKKRARLSIPKMSST